MPFMGPDHTYDDYVRLHKRLRHDGAEVSFDEAQPGDFVYVSDGPRIITGKDEYGHVFLPDLGGPITGGVLRHSVRIYRGGSDHVLARADYQAVMLERRKKKTGRVHG